MPTNQQRREAERRRLQRQLEERRAREAARKRRTLILSIVGTIVLIAVIIVVVVVTTSGSGNNNTAAGGNPQPHNTTPTPTPTPTASTTPPAITTPTAPCAGPPSGTTAKFKGVTLTGAKDLKHAPKIKSLSEKAPTTVQCMDVVVGKGKPASSKSTVKVQYAGVLYKNGTAFDSSWSRGGKPVSFPLTGVIPGFTQGIGGAGKVAPMRVGGRRIMILPSALAYAGNPPQGSNIPVNAPLVFVVDLKSVTG